MGEVYRARDSRLGRDVALKILSPLRAANPQFRQRFEREARAVVALSHPHICRLHDIGSQDGTDFLVMEYLEGETLERPIVRGPLSIAHVLQYGAELADALRHAHRRGIVHRDLKPSNVMLTNAGAMLLDFGIVKWPAIESARECEALTETDTSDGIPAQTLSLTAERALLGTLAYMAPELLEGNEADSRTDIFAFGCVLYEMTTGRKAFEGPTRGALIASILESDPLPIHSIQPSVPRALERVILKCLAKDPENRWSSQTLLQAAEEHGVGIPSFCRQGQCGTCKTKLLGGNVRMDAEEGLDPESRALGFVLTCVGHADSAVKLDA